MLDTDGPASGASGRGRPRLELVPDSTGVIAAGTQDLFADDENDAALTQIQVEITVAPTRDPESQRRFDEFWRVEPAPEDEPAAVYRPVFPQTPFLQRPAVQTALVCAAAIALAALWASSFVRVVSSLVGLP